MVDHYDTLELELGDRASQWLFIDELGSLYTRVEDRAWAVVAGCYRKVIEGCPEEADRWHPQIDEDGTWRMPSI